MLSHSYDALWQLLCTSDCILCTFLQRSAILTLHSVDLDLLLGDFFSQELDSLRFLLVGTTHHPDSVLAELKVELVNFALSSPHSCSLILKIRLELIQADLQGSLLPV